MRARIGRAAVLSLGLAACVPLLDLDGTRDRPARVADSGTDALSSGCTSNGDCTSDSEGLGVCVKGTCVKLDDEPSKYAVGAQKRQLCFGRALPDEETFKKAGAFVVGALLPLEKSAPGQLPNGLAYTLALEEIKAANGIVSGGTRHGMAMIVCDSDPALATRSIEHLTHDLRLPAIITLSSPTDLAVHVETAVDAGAFTLNPAATSDAVKYKHDDRLVWSLLGTPEDVALAYRPALLKLEKVVKTNPAIRGEAPRKDGPIRVALIVAKSSDASKSSEEQSMATILVEGPLDPVTGSGRALQKALEFNGKTVIANGDHFKRLDLGLDDDPSPPEYSKIDAELDLLEPDVVIALTRLEVAKVAARHEDQMAKKGRPPPLWLLGTRNYAAPANYIAENPSRRDRFFGINYAGAPAETSEQRTKWLARMANKYSTPKSEYEAYENYYDAVYWLAYGLAGAGPGAPLEGREIGDGIRTLVDGKTRVYPGPTDALEAAFHAIGQQDVSFEGALGPPNIDKKWGTWKTVGSVYCYEKRGDSFAPVFDKLRFDPSDGELKGTSCIVDF